MIKRNLMSMTISLQPHQTQILQYTTQKVVCAPMCYLLNHAKKSFLYKMIQ